jgi:hypothetical protein
MVAMEASGDRALEGGGCAATVSAGTCGDSGVEHDANKAISDKAGRGVFMSRIIFIL